MHGLNRYRLFEASWLDSQGCPESAIVDIFTRLDVELDTFSLKITLDDLQMAHFATFKDYQNALEEKLRSLGCYKLSTDLLDESLQAKTSNPNLKIPLRCIDKKSDQPYLSILWIESIDGLSLMEDQLRNFAWQHDNKKLSAIEVSDLLFQFCQSHDFNGICGLSSARRGGISIACVRGVSENSKFQNLFVETGIE